MTKASAFKQSSSGVSVRDFISESTLAPSFFISSASNEPTLPLYCGSSSNYCTDTDLSSSYLFYTSLHQFTKGYFYSRSFQKYSRTSEENSRTFQGYPTIFQFSTTFQGPCEP